MEKTCFSQNCKKVMDTSERKTQATTTWTQKRKKKIEREKMDHFHILLPFFYGVLVPTNSTRFVISITCLPCIYYSICTKISLWLYYCYSLILYSKIKVQRTDWTPTGTNQYLSVQPGTCIWNMQFQLIWS